MSNEYLDIAMKKVIKQEDNAVLDKIRAEMWGMNATVMCEKCGKPLGVFDGNTCADCSKIEQIRTEIEGDMLFYEEDNCNDKDTGFVMGLQHTLDIIDKYTK